MSDNEEVKLIQTIEQDSKRTIPEAVFVNDFLPYFCGDIPITEQVMSTWYLISNNGFSEVDVIGDMGKVAGTVPAILDRPESVSSNAEEKRSITYMLQEFNSMSTVAPRRAEQDLRDSLISKFPNETEESLATKAKWESLLNVYGKSLTKESKSTAKAKQVPDDDISYD